MKKKYLVVTALAMALSIGSAMSSFAAGFVSTPQGVKYQWGSGDYCTNNWVNYKSHWFFFGNDQLMRTGWIQKDNTWYYATDTGELQGGIMRINDNVYYFNTSTLKMMTGLIDYNGSTHYFTENGTSDGGPYVYTEWNSNGTIRRGKKLTVR
jgi:glucan-binding YG repeat protein